LAPELKSLQSTKRLVRNDGERCRFQTIHSWIINMASLAQNTPLELMLDLLIGNPKALERKIYHLSAQFNQYYFSDEKDEKILLNI